MNTQTLRFTGRALYGHRICNTTITRKDEMREGYVARNFHIPTDIDDKLRMEAVKKRIRFSDMAIVAFTEYFKEDEK
jgi:hypothetical protein